MSEVSAFSIARLPRIEFGCGMIEVLPRLIGRFGSRVLFVTGAGSFVQSENWDRLQVAMQARGRTWFQCSIETEPSPALIDARVQQFRGEGIEVVVGIGGGSALDAAKAIAGLLRLDNSVMDFLEGVGAELEYPGPAVPFIAVPTTAGTGSEATKNAVLSRQGRDGFKKSFRDDALVAEYALLDPDLLTSCPASLIAANGMDALTQLMESCVSLKANPMTDALALSGLQALSDSLLVWFDRCGDEDPRVSQEARSKMAYASLLSGISLAQTGLGSVHGLASPLGAFFPIPHGVVCGSLVADATDLNIRALRARDRDHPALARYVQMAEIITGRKIPDPQQAWGALVDTLKNWSEHMGLPRLGEYGVEEADIERIVANSRGSSMQTNPVVLSDDEIAELVRRRL